MVSPRKKHKTVLSNLRMKNFDDLKRRAAERALEFVVDGNVVGLGTGSTAKFAIEGLGQRVKEGLNITGVATSIATERLAREVGIPIISLNDAGVIDVTLDGADEVDPAFNMIKGGGGALTREKLVALASTKRVMLVDDSKLVQVLGQSRQLPVEVLPFSSALSKRQLENLGSVVKLRGEPDSPFITDNGNHILDCAFGPIEKPSELERRIKLLPGVIESGLFIGIADVLVIAFEDRVEVRERPV
jgi:ribose 5-phosphate isomerase A